MELFCLKAIPRSSIEKRWLPFEIQPLIEKKESIWLLCENDWIHFHFLLFLLVAFRSIMENSFQLLFVGDERRAQQLRWLSKALLNLVWVQLLLRPLHFLKDLLQFAELLSELWEVAQQQVSVRFYLIFCADIKALWVLRVLQEAQGAEERIVLRAIELDWLLLVGATVELVVWLRNIK